VEFFLTEKKVGVNEGREGRGGRGGNFGKGGQSVLHHRSKGCEKEAHRQCVWGQ